MGARERKGKRERRFVHPQPWFPEDSAARSTQVRSGIVWANDDGIEEKRPVGHRWTPGQKKIHESKHAHSVQMPQ